MAQQAQLNRALALANQAQSQARTDAAPGHCAPWWEVGQIVSVGAGNLCVACTLNAAGTEARRFPNCRVLGGFTVNANDITLLLFRPMVGSPQIVPLGASGGMSPTVWTILD